MDFTITLMLYVHRAGLVGYDRGAVRGSVLHDASCDFSKRYSNRLMRVRVAFQAAAVLLFVLFAYFMDKAG